MADRKITHILDSAIWINIHTLSKTSMHSSLEVRSEDAFGGRWDTNYTFRGLLEPQLELPSKVK